MAHLAAAASGAGGLTVRRWNESRLAGALQTCGFSVVQYPSCTCHVCSGRSQVLTAMCQEGAGGLDLGASSRCFVTQTQ